MIPEAAVIAASKALMADKMSNHSGDNAPQIMDACEKVARKVLEAAAPHMLAADRAVAAVLALHRELPCLDEDGDAIGGSYCEECKDFDDHSGERVHEVYPCMTVREITAALAGAETFTAMRARIESHAHRPTP